MTDPQLFSIIGSVLGVGIALAALIIGLIAWLRADMKTDRAEAAQDRRAWTDSAVHGRIQMSCRRCDLRPRQRGYHKTLAPIAPRGRATATGD